MRKLLVIVAALLAASCAPPPAPPPPPPPPAPVVQPIPVKPQEELSIQGRSQPAGPGKQSVVILVNGERIVEGMLTTASPRGTFRGKYRDHEIVAKCALVERVDCEILVDGAPETPKGDPDAPATGLRP